MVKGVERMWSMLYMCDVWYEVVRGVKMNGVKIKTVQKKSV